LLGVVSKFVPAIVTAVPPVVGVGPAPIQQFGVVLEHVWPEHVVKDVIVGAPQPTMKETRFGFETPDTVIGPVLAPEGGTVAVSCVADTNVTLPAGTPLNFTVLEFVKPVP